MASEGQSEKTFLVFMTVSLKMERGMDTWEVSAMMGNILSQNGKMVYILDISEDVKIIYTP
jgi:hypothetical protein